MTGTPLRATGYPLVGRTPELEVAERALESVALGEWRGLALVGDPGIGKTALLQTACERGQEAGLRVLRGQASELDAEVPFGMFVAALDHMLQEQRAELAGLGVERLGELATIFPSLGAWRERASTGLQAERFRFHYAVRTALERLAAKRPLLLALDDVHWADRSSVELLAFLLRHRISAPLMLLFAYRGRQAPELLLHATAAAAREGNVATLELGPLSAAEADQLLGEDLDRSWRSALYRESGGNPFYLIELARVRTADAISPRGPETDTGAFGAVPSRVRAAIAHEVGAASPDGRALLEAAAVIGEPFEFELAAGVAELEERAGLDALDELARLELVRTVGVPGRYAFRHPIVRRAVYESAGAGFRLGAHRRAAEVLERWGASPAERAHHVERSARVGDRAAIAALTAAADATALRAPTTAARWLGGALRLLPADAPPEERLELLIQLATALGTSGRIEESRSRLAEALPLLAADQVVVKARLVGAIARLDHMVGRHGAARELLERALDDAGTEPSAGSTALKVELALDHWFADEWDETVVAAGAARADARALGERLSYATAAGLEAIGRGYLGQVERARALANESAGVIDALTDVELAARVEALVVLSHAEFGGIERIAEAARHADRGLAISRATGQDSWYVMLMCERCVANLLMGRLAEAAEAAEGALESARLGHPQMQIWALTVSCWVELLEGNLARAVELGEEAVAIVKRAGAGLFSWVASACLGMALLDAGEPERARELILENAGGPELELVDRGWLTHWYTTLTFAELALGDLDAARRWADRSLTAAEAFSSRGRIGQARWARAALELQDGNPERAAELALDAAEALAAAAFPIEAGRARTIAGKALGRLGQRDRAIEVLRRAHAELHACGARGYRDQAAQELRSLGGRTPRPPGPGAERGAGPDVLTPRELEVAELVARGLTNRQIAAELYLSPKTIESHMTRILKKTGAPSRAALAAAVERSRRDAG